ncbi:Concanavalin A-like lectin/glucanase, subgroup [Cynara cardunculus var. scolymus]|uniref:Concanavalin A-like lectin/glucanase, subgroup n=1 Tax=Cynara cardunculus var. scolymus TaxID=59895 RepID=A0A118JSJ9_CYNCS|nr:Concanavalin A-like lectin/glucanase, subgroup [Cynara cardunculus var. scolymus]
MAKYATKLEKVERSMFMGRGQLHRYEGLSAVGQLVGDIGGLTELTSLILSGCSFRGNIPPELGNLKELSFLALNTNNLTGEIPPSLGYLSNLYWLDLAENQLTGSLPISSLTQSGLDKLKHAKHFRLDRNNLEGEVPSNLNNLTRLGELNLGHNNLSGALPDLNGMNALTYVDLSNNSFQESSPPTWFSTLPSLGTLMLKNNNLNDTLSMDSSISDQLQLVDLQSNEIRNVTLSSEYKNTLELHGNPVCDAALESSTYCQLQQRNSNAYSTSLAACNGKSCHSDQKLSPRKCNCAYPYEGILYFRAPSFRILSNADQWHSLESSLWTKLGLSPGSVSLQDPFFNIDDYLEVSLQLFPSKGKHFSRTEVQMMGFFLSNQTYKPPDEFGPYYFIASPYLFSDGRGGGLGVGGVIGISIGCTLLILILITLVVYAVQQKKRAEKAISLSKPFDSGGAPQLKGARWFSYDELKKSTSNFSEINQIGSGGYGKVYRGVIPGGQMVAIKRAQQGSMQGGLEFKTEIELLSRVHHKNLVGLVGFCFEQGEQMLVYEFMPNGTLRESLSAMQCVEEAAADRPTMSDVVKTLETMLMSDGLHTNSTSASSSATEFGSVQGAPNHPYHEGGLKTDDNHTFDYSGGYNITTKIEPK